MGDPEKASLWADADVYVTDDLEADVPEDIDDPFPAAWGLVGLLSGEDGFTETREEEKNDHFAWGGILVRTSRRNFKLAKRFVALEDNATTRGLIWPGSTSSELIVPRPRPVKLAFETREGDRVRRLITKRYAEVDLDGDVVDGEQDLTKYELLATIFPTAGGVLFEEQDGELSGE